MTTITEVTNAALSALSLGLTTPLTVANGGTGNTTLTNGSLLVGAGIGTVTTLAPGANLNVLTSNGSTWTSGSPSGGAMSLLHANSGTNLTNAPRVELDSVVISGLTAKDLLLVQYLETGADGNNYIYLADSSGNVIDQQVVVLEGPNFANQSWINQLPGTATTLLALCLPSYPNQQTYTDTDEDTVNIPAPGNNIGVNNTFGTWTGIWILRLQFDGTTSSINWSWNVYKMAGQ